MIDTRDTITAPATAAGGALAVIRVSGSDALRICDTCFRSASGRRLSDRRGQTVGFGRIVDEQGAFVDEVLVSVFRAPSSYTGEDMAEISCHGSRWIVSEIIRLLCGAGARPAEAGEFTVRAYLSGRIDLAQAEAVADMISAENGAAHRLAASQLRGDFSAALAALRDELVRLASLLELELDFSEEDVAFADRSRLEELLLAAIAETDRLTDSFTVGNAIREGVAVAIVGDPNVGKSTLLNRLCGDDLAIVSDIAGTTRDVIQHTVVISGIGFRFMDTAGIRQSADPLERIGIERTWRATEGADIVLCMADGRAPDRERITALAEKLAEGGRKTAIVLNKCDDPQTERRALELIDSPLPCPAIALSAGYDRNIDRLRDFLVGCIDRSALDGSRTIVSNARHRDALAEASAQLRITLEGLRAGLSPDLLAADLRAALTSVGRITGRIDSEDLLHEIFSKFCIGK